jgi:hypothetical protein
LVTVVVVMLAEVSVVAPVLAIGVVTLVEVVPSTEVSVVVVLSVVGAGSPAGVVMGGMAVSAGWVMV